MPSELNEHGHIPGIYNYCNRWCEKCRFQLKCRLYSDLSDRNGNLIKLENTNELLEKMEENFDQSSEPLSDWVGDEDFDFNDAGDDEEIRERMRRQEEKVEKHLLGPLTLTYSKAARIWSDKHRERINEHIEALNSQIRQDISLGELSENALELKDALETIGWHMYQIHVKTKRALHGLFDEDDEIWDNDIQTDANGSAKVVLSGIDDSVAAFETILKFMPGIAADTSPLIGRLKTMISHIEQEFPNARKFLRAGFDADD